MSAAGNYRFLERQIKVHHEWMQQPCTFQEATRDWYQSIYLPVIHIIRQRGMLRDFPTRTETDLFVWIEKHRQEVIQNLGWALKPETIAAELVDQYSQAPGKQHGVSEKKLRETLTPEALQSGPMPGEWRNRWQQAHQEERLFRHILVALNGRKDGWSAMKVALNIAQRENRRRYMACMSARKLTSFPQT